MPPWHEQRRQYYESKTTTASKSKKERSQGHSERSEISFFTGDDSNLKQSTPQPQAPPAVRPPPPVVSRQDASCNTDPVEPEVVVKMVPAPPAPLPVVIKSPISRRDRAVNTDAQPKVRTANHGTSTVKITSFAKGTSTGLFMKDLVTSDELEAKVQEAIFKTEEEIMGCPLLQKAMAKVEADAIRGEPASDDEEATTKGQLISKCPYEKSVSSKIPTKIFLGFLPYFKVNTKRESMFCLQEDRHCLVLTLK